MHILPEQQNLRIRGPRKGGKEGVLALHVGERLKLLMNPMLKYTTQGWPCTKISGQIHSPIVTNTGAKMQEGRGVLPWLVVPVWLQDRIAQYPNRFGGNSLFIPPSRKLSMLSNILWGAKSTPISVDFAPQTSRRYGL